MTTPFPLSESTPSSLSSWWHLKKVSSLWIYLTRDRPNRRRGWWYDLAGPSPCWHFGWEFNLWICLTLLTASAMRGLYKDAFEPHNHLHRSSKSTTTTADHGRTSFTKYLFGGWWGNGTTSPDADQAFIISIHQDWLYLACTSIWLARYFLFRWWCAWDPSTHRSPTLRGWMAHLCSSHLSGGQVFDRPAPAVIFKQLIHAGALAAPSSSGLSPAVTDTYTEWRLAAASSTPHNKSMPYRWWHFVLPPFSEYAWNLILVRMVFPCMQFWQRRYPPSPPLSSPTSTWSTSRYTAGMGSSSQPYRSATAAAPPASRTPHPSTPNRSHREALPHDFYYTSPALTSSSSTPSSYWWGTVDAVALRKRAWQLWILYGPTLQFLIPTVAFFFYSWLLYQFLIMQPPPFLQRLAPSYFQAAAASGWPYQQAATPPEPVWNLIAMDTRSRTAIRQEGDKSPAAGLYRKRSQLNWLPVLGLITSVGTFLSLLFFDRLLIPCVDQVAGGNVLSDFRQDSKSSASGGGGVSSSTSGSSAGKSHRTSASNSNMTSSGGHLHGNLKDPVDTVWTERTRPIATENRLYLFLYVVVLRCLENWLVCVILPRTLLVCRLLGHCHADWTKQELSQILYPVGPSGIHRSTTSWLSWGDDHELESHWSSFLWSTLGVVGVTIGLLLTQTLLLNKSYLASLGYIAREWSLMTAAEVATATSSEGASAPTPWEPRRKYKKGDLVSYPPGASAWRHSVFRATINAPEGKPVEWRRLRGYYEALSMEMGHPSTSKILGAATEALLSTTMGIIVPFYVFGFTGSLSFWLTMAALLLATRLVATAGEADMSALQRLKEEAWKGSMIY